MESLREEIGGILGVNQGHTVVVLGAGNLGCALIENFKFNANGFQLLSAFDVNPELVGTTISGIPVVHADQLEDYLRRTPVSVGLLAVPMSAAQGMADRLVRCGVSGIWNFTNYEISAPEHVVVESVHFSDSLLALSYMITQRERSGDET